MVLEIMVIRHGCKYKVLMILLITFLPRVVLLVGMARQAVMGGMVQPQIFILVVMVAVVMEEIVILGPVVVVVVRPSYSYRV